MCIRDRYPCIRPRACAGASKGRMSMSETAFIPVLLGSDVNVYGMARSFHEAYGIPSVAVAKGLLLSLIHILLG